jgi:hypothetical protein
MRSGVSAMNPGNPTYDFNLMREDVDRVATHCQLPCLFEDGFALSDRQEEWTPCEEFCSAASFIG